MDAAYISALAALSGSAIGGVTSLAASWLSQTSQARIQRLAEDKERRQTLYNSFIEEASKLYGKALVSNTEEITDFVGLYTLVSRMRVQSPSRVIDAAERVIRKIVDANLSPNKTLADLHDAKKDYEIDLLIDFSEACRADLHQFRS